MVMARAPKPGRMSLLFTTTMTFAAALAVGLVLLVSPAEASVSTTETVVFADETSTVSNSGTWSSPFSSQGSVTTITADVGSVTQTGVTSGTWSWSHRPDDGLYQPDERPSPQSITIRAHHSWFGESSTSSATFRLYVYNTPPSATFNAPSSVVAGDPISLSLTEATDPSGADRTAGFQYAFDCGTGSGFGEFSTTSTASCPAGALGALTVKGKVRDKDGGEREYTDTVRVLPSLGIGDARVKERNTSARFTVSLSAPSQEVVTVDYATAEGTARAPADYTAKTGTLTFAPDETSKVVTVQIKGDRRNERNETFFVKLSGATNAIVSDASGKGTIIDND